MKRVLAFLLLFGSTLALVVWLDRRGEERVAEEQPPPPTPPRRPERLAEGEGIRPGAEVLFRGFDVAEGEEEAPLRFEVRAADSDLAEENVWKLTDVTAEVFDPEDGQRQVRVRAESGLARVADTDVPYQPSLEALDLSDVEALVERGAPVVPLDVTSPRVLMPLATRNLVAPGEASFSGESLRAQGKDALLDFPNAQLAFGAEGEIVVQRPDGTEARFRSEGKLRAYRDASATTRPPLFVSGEGGTEIRVGGERPAELSARTTLMRLEEPEGETGFLPYSLEMEGDARWSSNGAVFTGETMTGEFDRAGLPTRAVFRGLPTATVPLTAGRLPGLEPGALAGEDALRLAGEGEMELRQSGARQTIRLGGPATAATRGAELRVGGRLDGWLDTGTGAAGLEAFGGVVLETESATLEAAEAEARFAGPREERGEDEADLVVTARGGARIDGELGDGRRFTLSTPDRLVAERRGLDWRVVEASDVVFTLEGPDGTAEARTVARARRLLLLDLASSSLLAEGDVSYSGPRGEGRGERARVQAGEALELEGGDASRARFEIPEGSVEARRLEIAAGSLTARGDVRASFRAAGGSGQGNGEQGAAGGRSAAPGGFDLASQELDVAWEELPDGTRRVDLEARQEVEARLRDEQGASVVRADTLEIARAASGALELTARGEVETTLHDPRGTLVVRSRELRVDRRGDGQDVQAEGDVRFTLEAEAAVEGEGHVLALYGSGKGRLVPLPGGRVRMQGALDDGGTPFELTAALVEVDGESLVAVEPELRAVPAREGVELRAHGRRLRASARRVELAGAARVVGTTRQGLPWTLQAERVWFEGQLGIEEPARGVRGMHAEGGVRFTLSGRAEALGERLTGSPLGIMRLEGEPARIESAMFRLEAEWVEFDPELQIVVATGKGTILPPRGAPPETNWSLRYLAAKTLIEPDSIVFALQEPELESELPLAGLRASWAVLWMDRQRWSELPARLEGEADSGAAPGAVAAEELPRWDFFGRLRQGPIARYLREAYFEGPVELTRDGRLFGRAGAMYLDVVAGHGWVSDATVNVTGDLVGQDFDELIVRAAWLRSSEDGSWRADSATVTPCDQARPHVRIVTGDLRITPQRENTFELSLRDNRIELYDLIKIPLPPIRISTDKEYKPLWQTLRLADSARFGAAVSAGIRRPAEGVGKAMNKVFRGNPFDYDASYSIDASWLGSRGVLLDLGLEAESKDSYWLDMYLGGLPDRGEDRGYIRVDEGDRSNPRLWYRADGRWLLGEHDRIDLDLSYQTDAGVQSEFFESEFTSYERDESYLRWTRARNGNFYEAAVSPRLEGFRSQVEELPSAGAYGGRRPVASLGGVDVLYSGEAQAAYLRRRAGDFEGPEGPLQSPFSNAPPLAPDDEFADGFGDRDVLRVDTDHRLEAPVRIDGGGLTATPFLGGRFTAWDEGTDPDRQPWRARAEAGLRLAASLWKRTASGLHQLVPFVEGRGQLAMERDGGGPVPFDEVEVPIEGSFVDLGVRGRFGIVDGQRSRLDVEIRQTWADDTGTGQDEGWLPTAIFARLDTEPFGVPVEFWHDGRHDLSTGETVYSLVGVAVRPTDDLRLEASHHFGRDRSLDPFFEAASVYGIYRWTEKWEFEARQTFSLLEDAQLGTRFVVRRFGHDAVVEFEVRTRAGEGNSFSIGLEPRFGWHGSRVGYLNY